MKLADQWRHIEQELPEGWSDAQLLLRLADADRSERAAALLSPLMPGRTDGEVRFHTGPRGTGAGPHGVRRLLRRLDGEGIRGDLELVASAARAQAPPAPVVEPTRLEAAWVDAVASLPPDWSDAYAELELTSTDHLDRAALLLSPVNPARFGERPGFRFRCARRFGYGASPGMVQRCLARVDEEGIQGRVRILRALSETDPVATQGPVWYLDGKAV